MQKKNDASKLVGTLENRGQNNSLPVTQRAAGSRGAGTQTSLFPAPCACSELIPRSRNLACVAGAAPLPFVTVLQTARACSVQSKTKRSRSGCERLEEPAVPR